MKPKFVKTHPDAIIPTVRDKIYYDIHLIGIDDSIGIHGNEIVDGERIYYFRTGLKVIQPSDQVMYLHQKYFDYEQEYFHGFTFQNKITVIPHNDQSEIIIPMRESSKVSDKDVRLNCSKPIATLISRKKNELVYIIFLIFPPDDGEKVFYFMQVNENEEELNYLINILVPARYNPREYESHTFYHLHENYTKDEARTVQKIAGSYIQNGVLKHILLKGKNFKEKSKSFSEYFKREGPEFDKFFKKHDSESDVFDPEKE